MKTTKLSVLWEALGLPLAQSWDVDVQAVSTDSRSIGAGSVFVAITGERFDGHDYVKSAVEKGAKAVVISRCCDTGNLPSARVATVKDTVQAYLDMAKAYRETFAIPVAAVTGSVGKTTTKDMTAAVLSQKWRTAKTQANLNNEIGLPSTLFTLEADSQALVVELGMQGPGEIRRLAKAAAPTMGVITGIGQSHLEQLGSRKAICAAKMELADYLRDRPLLLCGDDDLLRQQCPKDVKILYYGTGESSDIQAAEIAIDGTETIFTLRHEGSWWNDGPVETVMRLPVIGRHNVQNALAAYGVGRLAGLTVEQCKAGLLAYTPSGMRQKVVCWRDCTVVEDCYNASPDSMKAAMTALGQYPCTGLRIAVLGDMLELGAMAREYHREVGLAASQTADVVLCWGDLAQEYLAGGDSRTKMRHFRQKETLAATLSELAVPGSVIWIKGSRGTRMEDVAEALYRVFL